MNNLVIYVHSFSPLSLSDLIVSMEINAACPLSSTSDTLDFVNTSQRGGNGL